MSFADRLRAWFRGETKRSAPSPSTDKASRVATRELSDFVDSRHGVEAFLEPRTALYSTTLLLVADDGEYFRRPIGDPRQAGAFCHRHDIPLYDARKVGYPQRMRDYERGQPQRRISLDDLPPWPGPEATTDRPEDAPPDPADDRSGETTDERRGDEGDEGHAPG